MSNMTQTTKTQPVHDGPCSIDLDLGIGGCRMEDGSRLTTRVLADRAIEWADGLEDWADLLPVAREALDGQGQHDVTREQFDALSELLHDFANYVTVCGYASDGDFPDDALIGSVMQADELGHLHTWLYCDKPCEWTETNTFVRYGEDRSETVVHRAMAHS